MWQAYRLQSALQYILTYGWMVLILVVAISGLVLLGLFSPQYFVGQKCLLEAGFTCTNYTFTTSGLLTFTITQDTYQRINLTGVACYQSTANIITQTLYKQLNMPYGSSQTVTVQCYNSNGGVFTNLLGQLFTGNLQVSYINLQDGFGGTATGSIAAESVVTPVPLLYITNSAANNAVIINSVKNTVVGAVSGGLSSPYGIGFAPSGAYAYISNVGSGNVVILNTTTGNVMGAITGSGISTPSGIAFAPSGTYAYIENGASANILIVNTATLAVTGVITGGIGTAYGIAFAPSGTYAYVVNYVSNNVVIVNTATSKVTGAITSGAFSSPWGVAFSPSGAVAYVANYASNNVVIVNTATGNVVGAVTGGFSHPSGIAVSPSGTYLYVSNFGSSNVMIVNATTNLVVGAIAHGFNGENGDAFT